MREEVILVDEQDRPRGTAEKLAAHRAGLLHRAFSVIVFNSGGGLLLHRRAWHKYHSGGLWTNACCSHPRPGESTLDAANRRLREEMGFQTDLRPAGSLLYRAAVGRGLVEHEYDHILVGEWDGIPDPDPAEVADWRWLSLPRLHQELTLAPARFTPWFRLIVQRLDLREFRPRKRA
jgi:isopentenyl-diphosphate Delta-isomerase